MKTLWPALLRGRGRVRAKSKAVGSQGLWEPSQTGLEVEWGCSKLSTEVRGLGEGLDAAPLGY